MSADSDDWGALGNLDGRLEGLDIIVKGILAIAENDGLAFDAADEERLMATVRHLKAELRDVVAAARSAAVCRVIPQGSPELRH